jgi:tRNA pseudouridine55 synthase
LNKTYSPTTNFVSGQVLLFNKPLGWSSFQLVKKVRYLILKNIPEKKLKVGHAGTLDPLATGLMVICTGKMTKTIDQFSGQDKVYTGIFRLGATTPSFDLETEPTNQKDFSFVTMALLKEKSKAFLGEQMQLPPIFSAKQVDGKRAYISAREGIEVVLKPAKINVLNFEIIKFSGADVHFEIYCSKGTYIRTIAHNFGQILGCGAHLAALNRTKSGELDIENAIDILEFERMMAVKEQVK